MADCQSVGAVSLAMRLSGFGWQSRPGQEMGLGTRLPPRCRDQASPQVRCNPGYCSKWLDLLGKSEDRLLSNALEGEPVEHGFLRVGPGGGRGGESVTRAGYLMHGGIGASSSQVSNQTEAVSYR